MYALSLLMLCSVLCGPQAPAGPGYLGVFLAAADEAVVREVVPGTPAHNAGVRNGDVVEEVDGAAVATRQAFVRATAGRRAGEKVRLKLRRAGQRLDVVVTLAARKRRGGVGDSAADEGPEPAPRPGLEPQPQKQPPKRRQPGYLGVRVRVVGRELVVAEVLAGSPCQAANVQPGDVLVQLGGRPLGSLSDLSAALREVGALEVTPLTVRRGRRVQTRTVRTAGAPAVTPAASQPFWDPSFDELRRPDPRAWRQLQELRRELEALRERLERAERRRE